MVQAPVLREFPERLCGPLSVTSFVGTPVLRRYILHLADYGCAGVVVWQSSEDGELAEIVCYNQELCVVVLEQVGTQVFAMVPMEFHDG